MKYAVVALAMAGAAVATNDWNNWESVTTTSSVVPSVPAYTTPSPKPTTTTPATTEGWNTWTSTSEKPKPTTTSWYVWTTSVEPPKPSSSYVKPNGTTTAPVPTYTGAANKGAMVGGAAVGLAAIALML